MGLGGMRWNNPLHDGSPEAATETVAQRTASYTLR